jgi:hypothetical protein
MSRDWDEREDWFEEERFVANERGLDIADHLEYPRVKKDVSL